MSTPLWQWSAACLAQAIRGKKLSSQEVIQSHLDRIAVVNPKMNAITVVLAEDALRAAREADRKIAANENTGPLHGVPITIKENIDLIDSATTHGVVAFKDAVPQSDAPIVTRLKQAGAIPIGRTNMPDFGVRWHTDNDLYGATLNPWDPARTPGGSSGGEAAAIATGMSPLGVGNDIGGSLRYPAHCCGIASIKPSFGRVSRIATSMFTDPPLFYEQVASANGPLARWVKDLRFALDIMSQPDPNDPWWTPALQPASQPPSPIRVAVTTAPAGDDILSPIVIEGVRKAADILNDAGYTLEEIDPPAISEAAQTIQQIADIEVKSYWHNMLPLMSDDGKKVLEGILAIGAATPDLSTYMKAIGKRHKIAQEWRLFMERYPLILGPVSTLEPFEVGYDVAGTDQLRRIIRSLVLTETCNLLGLPSIVVPVKMIDGLPQVVQLIAPRFQEDLCFDAAEIIEHHSGVFTPIEPRDSRDEY